MSDIIKDIDILFNEFTDDIFEYVDRYIRRKGKYASGNFLNNLRKKMIFTDKGGSLKIDFDFNIDDYGIIIDKGRRPGKFVNVTALNKWMKIKNIPLKLSYPINRHIKEKGIKGIDYIDYSNEVMKQKYPEFERRLEEILVKYIENNV